MALPTHDTTPSSQRDVRRGGRMTRGRSCGVVSGTSHVRFLSSAGQLLAALLAIATMLAPAMASDGEIRVLAGIELLLQQRIDLLAGKRVGLVTNPTGVDSRLRSGIDLLAAHPQVQLVALFGPEHGVRGDVQAGDDVASSRDRRTGLPVHSLYGEHREPTPEMLDGIDVLV